MPRRIGMNLLSPSYNPPRIMVSVPPAKHVPKKTGPTLSIGVGMIDRLSKNVASCSACGH